MKAKDILSNTSNCSEMMDGWICNLARNFIRECNKVVGLVKTLETERFLCHLKQLLYNAPTKRVQVQHFPLPLLCWRWLGRRVIENLCGMQHMSGNSYMLSLAHSFLRSFIFISNNMLYTFLLLLHLDVCFVANAWVSLNVQRQQAAATLPPHCSIHTAKNNSNTKIAAKTIAFNKVQKKKVCNTSEQIEKRN